MTDPATFYQSVARDPDDVELARKRSDIAEGGVFGHVIEEVLRIAKRTPPQNVLEIGSGTGVNLAILKKYLPGTDFIATDIHIPQQDERYPFIHYVEGDAAKLRQLLPATHVDLILMVEVIEHLFDPDSVLEEVQTLLSPSGHLILTTPNLSSAVNRLSLLAGLQPLGTEVSLRRTFGRPGTNDMVGHIRNFTFNSICQMVAEYQFTIDSAYTVPAMTAPGCASKLAGLARVVDRFSVTFSRRLGSQTVLVLSR